jgi:hypothetical protein
MEKALGFMYFALTPGIFMQVVREHAVHVLIAYQKQTLRLTPREQETL